ncbi:MAG: NAD-dependent epimerase/dehydratase family protein [Anaerolineae bacterium]|nr:NAD-dependent epimerase/dehydratase family protein [Anaerolineae bacterium]
MGANVVEALLARGYEVRVLQRATSHLDALDGLLPELGSAGDLVVGDVTDYPSLQEAMGGCTWVIHAAAISQYWRSCPDLIYHINVTGTRNVLRAAQESGVRRVVVTSSVAALGIPTHMGQLLSETDSFNLHPDQFHYGHSKVLVEAEVARFVAAGLDVVVVNPASVIGQRDINFVGGEILRLIQKGQLLFAPPGGMGVVSAKAVGIGHVLAAERGKSGERYILNGENISHRALMAIVAEVTGATPPLWVMPSQVLRAAVPLVRFWNRWSPVSISLDAAQVDLSTRFMYFNGEKAARVLGFPQSMEQTSARAAVEEAWSWYRTYGLI